MATLLGSLLRGKWNADRSKRKTWNQIFQPDLVNLYGCAIGDDTKIGAFVEIQKNATIGARCKVSSHTFICEGVTIEDEVFVGHGVMFINDRYPRPLRVANCKPKRIGK